MHMRMAFMASFDGELEGSDPHDSAAWTIASTERSRMGAQCPFSVAPMVRNSPDGLNMPRRSSCSMSFGSKRERM